MKQQQSRVGMTGTSEPESTPSELSPSRNIAAQAKDVEGEERPLKIPPLLLEGDDPPTPAPSEPAPKFALRPTASGAQPREPVGLPAAYGTGRMLLMARDSHWLYTHWDLTSEQQSGYNGLSIHRHLVVRIHSKDEPLQPASEVHVHPESKSWFVEVARSATSYFAELGYYQSEGQWVHIARSEPARTPPEMVSDDKQVQFATATGAGAVDSDLTAEPMPHETATQAGTPFTESIIPSRVEWLPALDQTPGEFAGRPADIIYAPIGSQRSAAGEINTMAPWTADQELALAEMVGSPATLRGSVSSLELTQQYGQPERGAISSPLGPEAVQGKAFWFHLNAELVIYGATDPCGSLTVGGRPVELRPDGTFSFRLAFPDGEHEVAVGATSAEHQALAAKLEFRRCTEYSEQP
jgi:uncharacterized protein